MSQISRVLAISFRELCDLDFQPTEGLVLRCASENAAGWRWEAVVISVDNQAAVPRFRGPERVLGKATLTGAGRLKGP